MRKSIPTIIRSYARYRPLRFFTWLSAIPGLVGIALVVRWFVLRFDGDDASRVPSLVGAAVCLLMAAQLLVLGFLADIQAAQRKHDVGRPRDAAPPRVRRRTAGDEESGSTGDTVSLVSAPTLPEPSTTLHWVNADVEVHRVVVGPYENNVFVVRCRRTGEAALIDAANEHEQLLELCQRLGVRRVLETHGHWDHIQAVPAIREAGYEVAVTKLDAPKLADVGYDVFLDDAEVIDVGRLRLHAIHNPGHTPGLDLLPRRGHPAAVHRRHAVPRRAGQHEVRRRRLRHDHRVDLVAPVDVPGHDDRAPRPRCRHDDRRRTPAPRRVGRPRLVARRCLGPSSPGAVSSPDRLPARRGHSSRI